MIKKIAVFSLFCLGALHVSAGEVRVYAAASLTNAVTDIAKLYKQQHPSTNVVTVFGASSALAKQIESGAKADIYFSADTDWMKYLVKTQFISSGKVKNTLGNQLVAITPMDMDVPFGPTKQFNFSNAFKGHLCTGQMESVPVGKYAKQSLMALGWYTPLQGRIVGTDDVRSALAFVERGECDVGIVYQTDALISKKVKIIGTFPSKTHDPIVYPAALTKQGERNREAAQFEHFMLKNAKAKAIFTRYGFSELK